MADESEELYGYSDYLEEEVSKFPQADAFLKEYGLTISVVEDMRDHQRKFAIVFENPDGSEDTSEEQIKKFLTELLTRGQKTTVQNISPITGHSHQQIPSGVGIIPGSVVSVMTYKDVFDGISRIFAACDTDRDKNILLKDLKTGRVCQCSNFKKVRDLVDCLIISKEPEIPNVPPDYIAVSPSGDILRVSKNPVVGLPVISVNYAPSGDIVLGYR